MTEEDDDNNNKFHSDSDNGTTIIPLDGGIPFQGSNGIGEIETLEEFLLELEHHLENNNNNKNDGDDADDVSTMNFNNWSFVDINFCDSRRVVDNWDNFRWEGASFFGCSFPGTDQELRQRGAVVAPQHKGLPFKVYRSFMYTQHELQQIDTASYQFYLNDTSLQAKLAMQVHDHFVQNALFDYLEGKSVVSIMGGHQIKRSTSAYKDVVLMAHRLAKKGYLVASGGGPGAMEACNLGAYMYEWSDSEATDAIKLMIENQDPNVDYEYQDRRGPQAVIDKYGLPTHQPSLAVPTYKYGHEPTNIFGTWVCKFFSNAIREDGLLDISNAGIIYTPGSAGTRQEIFQAACGNHYASEGKEKPTIFYDTQFWSETGIPNVLRSVSSDRPFAKWIVESDSVDMIVATIESFREQAALPLVDRDQLQSKFWIRPALRHKKSSSDDYGGDDDERIQKKALGQEERIQRRKLRDVRVTQRRLSLQASDLPNTNIAFSCS